MKKKNKGHDLCFVYHAHSSKIDTLLCLDKRARRGPIEQPLSLVEVIAEGMGPRGGPRHGGSKYSISNRVDPSQVNTGQGTCVQRASIPCIQLINLNCVIKINSNATIAS